MLIKISFYFLNQNKVIVIYTEEKNVSLFLCLKFSTITTNRKHMTVKEASLIESKPVAMVQMS